MSFNHNNNTISHIIIYNGCNQFNFFLKGLRRGTNVGSNNDNVACQRHDNWEQCKVLVVIKCNDDNYVVEKDLVNPKTYMILTTQE